MARRLPEFHGLKDPKLLLDRARGRESGAVLIMALAFSIIVGTLLVGTLTTTILQAKTMRHELDATYAQGLAEGAIELAQKQMVDGAANFEDPPTSGTVTIDSRSINWTATQLGMLVERFDIDGVRMLAQPYEITASVDEGSATSRITRVADLTLSPMFQYAVFFNMLCEISPDAAMGILGRIHVNGDLYLDTPTTLDIDTDHLQATGGIYRGRLNEDTRAGIVTVRQQETTNYVELTEADDAASVGWVQSALSNWSGSVQSGAHGVGKVTGPDVTTIEPGGYYESTAGLKVIGTQAYNGSGLLLSVPTTAIKEQSFYDAREKKTVTVTEIDIEQLSATGFYPTNGLIYARRPEASVTTPNGIRIVNGSTLPTPLTIVTDNPLYIQGNFNTVNKQPASVIADAVNLLSNDWVDMTELIKVETSTSEETTDLDHVLTTELATVNTREVATKVASSTSYNLSILTGAVVEDGITSGGFENLVRLHEDWTGQTLTILGAIVVLFESQYATSPFSASAFVDPTRVFSFDPDLLDPALLPPYAPSGVYMRRVYWDDNRRIIFKIDDSKLSLFPETPVYDPWNYDGSYLSKIIDDPNAYLDKERKVDYSNKAEAEEPDTADRVGR